jgi:CRISPR-associated protein Csx17
MTLHRHILKGCAPAPLANYLKALGILRLVGEQVDPQARGWWDGERFCLLSKLSKEELETFFLEKYEPTPFFNPWGARSGYYPGPPEKTARAALIAIEESKSDRLARFREAISLIRKVITEGGGEKPEKADEPLMLRKIQLRLRGPGLEWLSTVVADFGDQYLKPAIFGTGGNEGSGGYTAGYLGAIIETIHNEKWKPHIGSSLWSDGSNRDAWNGRFQPPGKSGTKAPKKETVAGPFRQFLPEGEGSPWDLILAFEGALVIQSGVTRRTNNDRHRFLSSPFSFSPLGMGAGSSSEMDEFVLNKGVKNLGRGEQWFPLWGAPSTFVEIQQLFREGRCGNGRKSAKQPLDAARAICGLGAARGITFFLRYGYLQRDNLATHFAVPLGQIQVRENSNARLIDDLSGWLDRLHKCARNKNAPARLIQAERRLSNTVFAALTHDQTAESWQAILLAATEIEALQATGTAVDEGRMTPIPPLRPEWVGTVDDGSPEIRLAVALSSAAASYSKGRPDDPVRHHFLPLESNARRFKITDKKLVNDPRVVVSGRDPLRDLAAIVERRFVEASQKGQRLSRLVSAAGCGARLDDISVFLTGALDHDKLFGLARAFMAIKWDQWTPEHHARNATSATQPPECWLALRLCCLAWPLTGSQNISADQRIIRLMVSDKPAQAIRIAVQKLKSVGIRPPVYGGSTNKVTARLWAAALAFPIRHDTAMRAAEILDPSMKGVRHV